MIAYISDVPVFIEYEDVATASSVFAMAISVIDWGAFPKGFPGVARIAPVFFQEVCSLEGLSHWVSFLWVAVAKDIIVS